MAVVECDSTNEEVANEEGTIQGEIMAAKLLWGKPYTCPAFTPTKRKEKVKTKKKKEKKRGISV